MNLMFHYSYRTPFKISLSVDVFHNLNFFGGQSIKLVNELVDCAIPNFLGIVPNHNVNSNIDFRLVNKSTEKAGQR